MSKSIIWSAKEVFETPFGRHWLENVMNKTENDLTTNNFIIYAGDKEYRMGNYVSESTLQKHLYLYGEDRCDIKKLKDIKDNIESKNKLIELVNNALESNDLNRLIFYLKKYMEPSRIMKFLNRLRKRITQINNISNKNMLMKIRINDLYKDNVKLFKTKTFYINFDKWVNRNVPNITFKGLVNQVLSKKVDISIEELILDLYLRGIEDNE